MSTTDSSGVDSDDNCSSAYSSATAGNDSDFVEDDDVVVTAVRAPPKSAALKKSAAAKTKTTAKAPVKLGKKAAAAKAIKPATATVDAGAFTATSEDDNCASPPVKGKKAAPKPRTTKKTVEEIYQKKTQLEHILLRPDTYIGSTEAATQPMWVWNSSEQAMVFRDITYVPGFYKIFDEILVNAADNKIRDPAMDTIKVTIDKENNTISVLNNGRGIPIEIHSKEGVYVPELIFGHLLTSSNYDDDERKVTGGRNGYGAKLCNIFSRQFIVETADKTTGKKFKQVFSDNMSRKSEPQITSNGRKEEYTRITFKPDLDKFKMQGIDDDTEALLKKRVYDIAGCIRDIKVYLNDERIPVKNFRQYIDLYLKTNNKTLDGLPIERKIVHQQVNDRWEIAFMLSDGQFQQVSFVNSICTSKGGTHANYIADQITAKIADGIVKKNKAAPVKAFQIKNHMWIFVNCLIENPTFDSQTKEHMTLKQSAFGSKAPLEDDFLNKVKKSGLVESVLSWAKFKQDQQLKKTDGAKRLRISGITKLDDANNAGTRNGQNCTLILTEGDSAKTLAVTGLGVVGRDNYGVFPLRGKLLNVREASHKQIMENVEINNIKQIMGLQHGKKYHDLSSLRYGHLMIMTDQDHDGSHIKGLIINFIDHFWPELLTIPGFLLEFITPIVKVSKGGEGNQRRRQEIAFFTIPEYEQWKEENDGGKGWQIKYYKGLGTSTKDDAKKYFQSIDQHRKVFSTAGQPERDLIDMAFNKKKTDNRKDWLRNFNPGTFMDHAVAEIGLSDFVNKELILFSMADNIRSLPSAVDGLKPGLRKILFACFKRNLTKGEIKVAQLSGYIAEHSAYHHGEQSLQTSIVGLAQNFVGSNNVNLLDPRGQFGSRLQGGKDAASARYIFTRLATLTRHIYHKDDDAILKYLNDDGQSIEPEWYVPILPMVLVNGGEGIGTGWSSFIPNYNPRDIVKNLVRLMDGGEIVTMHPWYRGYNGTIEESAGGDKYTVSGTITKVNDVTLEITELPIRTWTQTYKEFLETLMVGTDKTPAFIKDYKEYHTDSSVHFVVTMSEENMRKAEAEGIGKKFKITTTISTSNMVCFDSEGRIRKYNSVDEILRDFFHLRMTFYQRRKEYMAEQLTRDWERLDNRVRFIKEIVAGKLRVQNVKKADLVAELRRRGYKSFPKASNESNPTPDNDENEDEPDDSAVGGYDYLLSMPLWSLTVERFQALEKDCQAKQVELDTLLAKSFKDLWRHDLDVFLHEFDKFENEIDAAENLSRDQALAKKRGLPLSKVKKVKKPLRMVSDDDEDDDDDDEDDADFAPKSKPVLKQSKKPVAKSIPPTKAGVSASKLVAAKATAPTAKAKQPQITSMFAAKTNMAKSKAPTVIVDSDDDQIPQLSFSEALALSKAGKRSASVCSDQPEVPEVKKVRSPAKSVRAPVPTRRARAVVKPVKYIEINDDDESGDATDEDDAVSEASEEDASDVSDFSDAD